MILSAAELNEFTDLLETVSVYVLDHASDYGLDLDDLGVKDGGEVDARVCFHRVLLLLAENPTVIDALLEDCAGTLTAEQMHQLSEWRFIYAGPFAVTRVDEAGNSVIVGRPGAFSLTGLVACLATELDKLPALVSLILLPFKNYIIHSGYVSLVPMHLSENARRVVNEEAERKSAGPVISTVGAYMDAIQSVREEALVQEAEELLAEANRAQRFSEDNRDPGKGFKRSPLADLDTDERIEEAYDAEFRDMDPYLESKKREELFDLLFHMIPGNRNLTLRQALDARNVKTLKEFAREFGVHKYSALRRDALVKLLLKELPTEACAREMLDSLVLNDVARLREALDNGGWLPIENVAYPPYSEFMSHPPFFQQVYDEKKGDAYWVIPKELRKVLDEVTPTSQELEAQNEVEKKEIADLLHRLPEELMGLIAFAIKLYGVVRFEDLVDDYMRIYGQAYTGTFETLAEELSEAFLDTSACPLTGQTEDGKLYQILCHPWLLPENKLFDGHPEGPNYALEVIEEILDGQEEFGRYPITKGMVEAHYQWWIDYWPITISFRKFLDSHVPEDMNEYSFADDVIEELIQVARLTLPVDVILQTVGDFGLLNHDKEFDAEVLERTAAFVGAIPQWEKGGYSAMQVLEERTGITFQLTDNGRFEIIAPDGSTSRGTHDDFQNWLGL